MILFVIQLISHFTEYISSLYRQDPLVFWTLIVVSAYTIVTYNLWRESVNQTGLGLMPFPAFYFKNKNGEQKIRIRNLGDKPLVNTEIESWNLVVLHKGSEEKWRIEFSIPFPNVIKADEERDLLLKTFLDSSETNFELWPHLHPKYAKFKIPLKVRFHDIRGIRYQAKFAMGKGKLNIISSPKRWKWYFEISDFFQTIVIEKIKKEYWRYQYVMKKRFPKNEET